ncbi:MAG: alpha/beta fold hydrolase [Sandaracinaceae bacterium]
MTTPGGRFEAIAVGPRGGTPTLLLHGFPDVPQTFSAVMQHLADRGHHCVAPFTRGYGPSVTRGPFHLEQLAEDATAIADAVFNTPAHWVGHDWGAATVHMAARGGSMRSAVTLSVPALPAFRAQLLRDRAQLRRSAYMLFFQLPLLPELALRRGLVARLVGRWSPDWVPPPGAIAEIEACLARSGYAPLGTYRALPRLLLRRGWRSGVPTLSLHGGRDGCIAPHAAEADWYTGPFERALAPGAGHFLSREAPEWVADHIARWCRLHTAS